MSTYMTDEEQIEAIKKWWNKYGNTISTVILVLVVGFAGFRYWQWHKQQVALQASGTYEQMMAAYANEENKAIMSRANKLVQNSSGTIYGDTAHLTLAKMAAEKKAYAKAIPHLNEVIKNDSSSALTQIAKLRLARILLAQKEYQSALETIDKLSNESYISMVKELRGDIYLAKGDFGKAKIAYGEALSTARKQKMGNLFLEMKTNDIARLQMSVQSGIKTA